jgi:hypothetical protein
VLEQRSWFFKSATDPFLGSDFACDDKDLPDASVCREVNRDRCYVEEEPPAMQPSSGAGAGAGAGADGAGSAGAAPKAAQDTEMEDVEAIRISVKITFDIAAESTEEASEKIHMAIHDIAELGPEISTTVGGVFDHNQRAKANRQREGAAKAGKKRGKTSK